MPPADAPTDAPARGPAGASNRARRPAVAAVPYRCVCGGTALVRPAPGRGGKAGGRGGAAREDGRVEDRGGGDCPACGRHFAASVLDDAGAATVSLPPVPPGVARGGLIYDDAADPGRLADAFRSGVLPDPPAARPLDETRPAGDGPAPRPGPANKDAPADPDATFVTAAPAAERKPAAAVLPPGAELEHFRIEALLGRGGMGAVYRALDLSLERFVALKVIRPDAAGSSRPRGGPPAGPAGTPGGGSGSFALDRLMQEARAQARVNHPNVAHIYFVSPDPADPFLAMELIDGPTLSAVLKKGPLPYGAVSGVGLQIARALACAGRFDIIHGDVKPSNVLLDGPAGEPWASVKLSDFGLARRGGGAASAALEGTPNYLAPEVVRGGPPTAKSDLYALGVTLFEATFGRLPYTTAKQGLTDRLHAHLSAAPEFPDPWPKHLPPDWRELLESLLAKNPADRPDDAAAVAAAVAELTPRAGVTAGLLVRALAWAADAGLVLVASLMLFAAVAMPGFELIEDRLAGLGAALAGIPLALLATAAGLVPSLVLAWRQARTGRTPGKSLFQTRVVDRHGLRPDRRTLFLRGLAQTLPVWGIIAGGLTEEVTGWDWLENTWAVSVFLVWLADHLPALVRRDRRTLHDWLLGTRVTLDAASPDPRAGD